MERFAFQYLEKQMENMEVQKLQKEKRKKWKCRQKPFDKNGPYLFRYNEFLFCETCNRYLVFIHTTVTYLVARIQQAEGYEVL